MPRGRKPTPTALKLVAGTRADRINDDEPQPDESAPKCPSKRHDVVRVWNQTLTQLQRMRVVTAADTDALHAYCEAVVLFREASIILDREGMIMDAPNFRRVHPAVRIQKEAAAAIKAFAGEFGLTPAARTRIRVGDQKPEKEQGAARLLSS